MPPGQYAVISNVVIINSSRPDKGNLLQRLIVKGFRAFRDIDAAKAGVKVDRLIIVFQRPAKCLRFGGMIGGTVRMVDFRMPPMPLSCLEKM